MELTAAYIKAGLEQNERCIWLVPDFQSAEKAKNLLSNSDLDIENRIEKSRLKIIPLKEKDDPSIKQTETSRIYFDWKAGNPQKEIIKFIHAGNWRYLRINLEVGAFGKSITTSLKELRCVLAENMPEKKIRPLFMIKEEDLSAEEVFNLIEAGEKLVIKREGKWKFLKIKLRAATPP
ncbi:DEAD/DEAH box helicase family protein [Methanosarcina mazei]|nr:hypothetical protein [Methanosarcina mazei]BBL65203.1 hypothetical protein MmazTMA_21800 [Methanosarcina mazei]